MKETIEVQFRKLKGEVFAVFPYMISNDTYVTSYAHIGQHSACAWHINSFSKPVSVSEYKALLCEIKQIYSEYKIKVIKRRNHAKFLVAYYKAVKERKELINQ